VADSFLNFGFAGVASPLFFLGCIFNTYSTAALAFDTAEALM
jgi:hypothetical protein